MVVLTAAAATPCQQFSSASSSTARLAAVWPYGNCSAAGCAPCERDVMQSCKRFAWVGGGAAGRGRLSSAAASRSGSKSLGSGVTAHTLQHTLVQPGNNRLQQHSTRPEFKTAATLLHWAAHQSISHGNFHSSHRTTAQTDGQMHASGQRQSTSWVVFTGSTHHVVHSKRHTAKQQQQQLLLL